MTGQPTPLAPAQRLIVALDVPTPAEALAFADALRGVVTTVKVGLELFVAGGPAVTEALAARGFSIMLDLKLHDVPATVRRALLAMRALPAIILTTVHAEPHVLVAAAEAQAEGAPPVLAVTVLTSLSAADLAAAGVAKSPAELVATRAQAAYAAGVAGVVCSPLEAADVRAATGPMFRLVTPGVRPAGATPPGDDQHRVMTPEEAVRAGADHLVVGRPIRDADDPAAAAHAIVEAIAAAARDES